MTLPPRKMGVANALPLSQAFDLHHPARWWQNLEGLVALERAALIGSE